MTEVITHTRCRLCDSGKIEQVIDLGYSPLANAYLTEEQLRDVQSGKVEEVYTPLRCFLCMECGSVQLEHSVKSEDLFSDYLYASSTSRVFVHYFAGFASHCLDLDLIKPGELVVDIGSNDGILLEPFDRLGVRAVGVEPCDRLVDLAERKGQTTIKGFFDATAVNQVEASHGKAKLITAMNVFAHVSDLNGFVANVAELLDKDGVFVFEANYLGDILDKMLFDTVYVEHCYYHSLTAVMKLLTHHGLYIFRTERTNNQGGSMRVYCDKRAERALHLEISPGEEHERGFKKLETYRAFNDRLKIYKHRLHSIIDRSSNIKMLGYGCPAKFTTYSHCMGISDQFWAMVDDSNLKAGKFTPGSHIPIRKSDTIAAPVRSVFVSAWNYFDSIYEKNKGLGVKWIRPLPNLEVIHA